MGMSKIEVIVSGITEFCVVKLKQVQGRRQKIFRGSGGNKKTKTEK